MLIALVLIGGVLNFFLGTAVLLHNPRKNENISFAVVCFLTVILIGLDTLFRFTPTLPVLRLAFAAAMLLATSVPIWVVFFLNLKWSVWKKVLTILPGLIFVISSLVDGLVIQEITELLQFGYRGVFGPLFSFYVITVSAYIFAVLFMLYRAYRHADEYQKKQIIFTSIGIATYSILAIFFSLILPQFFDIYSFTLLDAPSSVFFVVFSSYAILRHHLFDIKVIATEIFILGLILVQFSRMFFFSDPTDLWINIISFIAILIFSVLVIRSVLKEVQSRERIEHLAEELARANTQLTELNKQKSEFLSIASHQFRTPLTAIKGYSSMLLEGSFGAMSDTVRDAVSRVYQSSEHLVSVIDDFLNVSRIELGRMKYTFAVVNFKEFLKEAIQIERPSMDKSGLTFNVLMDEDESGGSGKYAVTIDGEKMQQVMFNLIENAIKYTPRGMITIALSRAGERVRLSIKDTGIGVAKKEQALLFKKFSRATGKKFTNIRGTGLGLYVAKEILKEHDGDIWMESEGEGLGSTFYLELPAGTSEKLLKKSEGDGSFGEI